MSHYNRIKSLKTKPLKRDNNVFFLVKITTKEGFVFNHQEWQMIDEKRKNVVLCSCIHIKNLLKMLKKLLPLLSLGGVQTILLPQKL